MGKHKVSPIAGWGKSTSQLEAWANFYTVFLGNKVKHPALFEMFLLIKETSSVSPQLCAQARQKPTSPPTLLGLIQQGFN